MPTKAHDDDLVMSLVESVLAQPANDREAYLQRECGTDSELLSRVWAYVQWEHRMDGFLLDPIYRLNACDQPFEPGDLLDERFRIVREIARGGMGVVYEGIDEKLERRIAIKCARIGFRRRLPPEVRNATKISHPNVCKTFDIYTATTRHGDIDFLTMEFVEGETLAERLRREPLTCDEARTIAQQLCAGIAEAHRNHVIHGDLKANNIILGTDGGGEIRVVITDFGLASGPEGAHSVAEAPEVGGAPRYMAPELWSGERPSVASDLFALGVILSELRETRTGLAQADGRKRFWEKWLNWKRFGLRSKWERLCARCIDPNPTRRPPNADELLQAVIGPSLRQWFLAATAAVVLVATTAVVTYERSTVPFDSGRLAVIPFVNAGSTPETQYLSDGISEGLINTLVQLPDVKVIARSSSFKFKGDKVDIRKAARTLGAQTLLMGHVAEMNGELRITAELVNGVDGRQIWGAQYSCKISELPGVQAEISRQIALHMSSKLTPSDRLKLAKATKVNPEAYALVLRGRYQMRLYTPESRKKAVEYFEQALGIDSGYALANAELGVAYRVLSASGMLSSSDAMPKAEAAAERALAIDSDLAEAHVALAGIKKDLWDWKAAEREYRQALHLSPNLAIAHNGLAICLSVTGQYDAAIAEIQHAAELDPIGLPTAIDAAAVYYNSRHYDRALNVLKRAANLDPSAPSPWTWMGIVSGGGGDYAQAVAAYEKALSLGDNTGATQCYYGYALARSGRQAEALRTLERVKHSRSFVPISMLAILYAGLGQREHAIQSLLAAYASKDSLLQYLNVESHFDTLRDDPRLQDLAARIGLPPSTNVASKEEHHDATTTRRN